MPKNVWQRILAVMFILLLYTFGVHILHIQKFLFKYHLDGKFTAKATFSGLCSILSSPHQTAADPFSLMTGNAFVFQSVATWWYRRPISQVSPSLMQLGYGTGRQRVWCLIWLTGFMCTNFLWSTSREIGLTFSISSLPSLSTKFLGDFLMSSSLRRVSFLDGSFKSLFVGWWYCKELTWYFFG